MVCISCGSDNTQRLQVIFEGGTQNINTESKTAGVGIAGGRAGFGGAVTTTNGTSQSILAQKAAPPTKKRLVEIYWILGALISFGSGSSWIVIGLIILGVAGYSAFRKLKYNSEEFPVFHQRWRDSWMCHKCGCIYQQELR